MVKEAAKCHDVAPVQKWAEREELVLDGQVEVGNKATYAEQHQRVSVGPHDAGVRGEDSQNGGNGDKN